MKYCFKEVPCIHLMQACCAGAGQDLLTSPTSSHGPPSPLSPPHEANASAIPTTSLTTFAARRLSRLRHMDRSRGRSFPIIRVRPPRAPHDASHDAPHAAATIRLSRRRHLDRARGHAFPIIRVRPPRSNARDDSRRTYRRNVVALSTLPLPHHTRQGALRTMYSTFHEIHNMPLDHGCHFILICRYPLCQLQM